jgi:hypothetical protein
MKKFERLLEEKNEVLALIEYDGKQHNYPIEIYGGEDSFKRTKINDNIKNKFAMSENIPLIRISYKQQNAVETLLLKHLSSIGIQLSKVE